MRFPRIHYVILIMINIFDCDLVMTTYLPGV